MTPHDEVYMAEALQLAERGLYTTDPNPRVGCVLVKNNQVIGRGWHQRSGSEHAEVHALREAGSEAAGATAYVSLEPCSHHGRTPPCAQALVESGVTKVIIAMQDPNPLVHGRGKAILEAAGIACEIGLLQQQAMQLNPGFVSRMTRNRPYLRSKIAMSLDGRTAMRNGESKWITGTAARQDVHRLRARSSAIVTGVGTVLADDPQLNVRDLDQECQPYGFIPPLRVVLDSRLRTPQDARILDQSSDTLVLTVQTDLDHFASQANEHIHIKTLEENNGRVDLDSVVEYLNELQLNEVLIEAGAKLNGAFLQHGLIDELLVYQAPMIMGHEAKPAFVLQGMEHLSDVISLFPQHSELLGQDRKLIYKFEQPN